MNTLTWLIWTLAALVFAGLTNNPLYLSLVLLTTALVFLMWREPTALARAYGLFMIAGFVLWLSYIAFSIITIGGGRGQTVLTTLPQVQLPTLLGGVTLGGPVTAEDIAWGAVRGLQIWVLMAIFGAFNALVDHYRLLRMLPRSLFHAGLAVTIAITFVPQLVRSIAEISEAQRLRGHRFRGPRSFLPLVAPLLAGSLENAIQLAEALDARGFGRITVKSKDIAPLGHPHPSPLPAGEGWGEGSNSSALRYSAKERTLGRQQAAVISGLLLLGGGLFLWLYYGIGLLAGGLLAGGVVLLGLALRSLGRLVPRTTYRRERWRRRDVIASTVAAGAAALWLVARITVPTLLIFNPYPVINAPPFSALLALLPLSLVTPALLRPRQPEGRAPQRIPKRSTLYSKEQRH